jgi:hypothetical protein
MTSGGALLVLFLLAIGGLSAATLATVARGGRGPGDPPASRPHVDPAGFFVLSEPRGLLPRHPAQPRGARRSRRSRTAVAPAAAATQTARESRTARRMSWGAGGRPFPRAGRTSIRLP